MLDCELAAELRIRPLAPDDASSLGQFFERLTADPETARYFHPFPLTTEMARRLCADRGESTRQDAYFLAVYHSELVGLGMLRGWDAGFAVPSFGGCVDPGIRDAGVGKALLLHAIEVARSRGAASLRLRVYRENVRAVNLYGKIGFQFEEQNAREWLGTLDLTQRLAEQAAAHTLKVDRLRAWRNRAA